MMVNLHAPVSAQHIFVIGLDGACGPVVEQAQTPQLDTFFQEGVVSYQAQTVLPSGSYEAWGAMLTGVLPTKFELPGRPPFADDSPWPTWLSRLGRAWDKPTAGVFGAWEPIITQLVEPGLEAHRAYAPDAALAQMAAAYIQELRPRLFFIQLDDPDHVGHQHGFHSEAYLDHLTTTDTYAGMVLEAIDKAGLTHESLTIILSDHGGTILEKGGFGHGGSSPEEMTILWAARGPGIEAGGNIEGPVSITDTAAVILTAAGVPLPDDWDAVVPEGVFAPA